MAGANTVIFSLWKVADAQTQELMGNFYRHWLADGMSKRGAFIRAQSELRKQYPDPYFWAAFVMMER